VEIMGNFTFTLIKETIIDIDMEKFIEKVNHLYNYNEEWGVKRRNWFIDICVVIDEMTLLDTWDYDNTYEIVRQILTNAIIYSRAKNDSKSVEILQEIIQSLR
jgi:hypothetical protein